MPKHERPDQEKLAGVERRIVESVIEITRQTALIDRLAGEGQETTEAYARLNLMKWDLRGLHAHRRYLLRRLQRCRAVGRAGPTPALARQPVR